MTSRHGNKFYLQVLLDPHLGHLLDRLAYHANLRSSALARQIIYDYLKRHVPVDLYEEAVQLDAEVEAQSKRNRVLGRQGKKIEKVMTPEPMPSGLTKKWDDFMAEVQSQMGG